MLIECLWENDEIGLRVAVNHIAIDGNQSQRRLSSIFRSTWTSAARPSTPVADLLDAAPLDFGLYYFGLLLLYQPSTVTGR